MRKEWTRDRGMALAAMLVGVCQTGFSQLALGQEYPTKPVRVIVPYPPGAIPDIISRLMAQQITPSLGRPVVVENRPGAGAISAITDVLSSPADGHTIMTFDPGQLIYPVVEKNVPYDPIRDFAPVGLIFNTPTYIAVRTSLPARDLNELIALAKAKPGELNYATYGTGSLAHLVMEAFSARAGIRMTHIPYKGGVAMVESVLRGDTTIAQSGLNIFLPHVKTGAIRLLAVVTKTRFKATPEVPTAQESGLPGFTFDALVGWTTRQGTPKPVLDKLSKLLATAATRPDVLEKAAVFGVEMTPSTPEEFAELIRADAKKFADAAKAAGINPQ